MSNLTKISQNLFAPKCTSYNWSNGPIGLQYMPTLWSRFSTLQQGTYVRPRTFKPVKIDNLVTRVNLLTTFATLIPNTGPHVLQKGPGEGVIYLQISQMRSFIHKTTPYGSKQPAAIVVPAATRASVGYHVTLAPTLRGMGIHGITQQLFKLYYHQHI